MVAIINYGSGNLYSVYMAVKACGAESFLIEKPEELKKASCVILPGVGAFGDGIENLKKTGMFGAINDYIRSGKQFLGICLGFQFLFSWSEEGNCEGLGFLGGKVIRFSFENSVLDVPHMGWNKVAVVTPDYKIFDGIPENSYFYFAHSYYPVPEDNSVIAGVTEYGVRFSSMIKSDNVVGVQFHPEKSGRSGLQFLKNFLSL